MRPRGTFKHRARITRDTSNLVHGALACYVQQKQSIFEPLEATQGEHQTIIHIKVPHGSGVRPNDHIETVVDRAGNAVLENTARIVIREIIQRGSFTLLVGTQGGYS